MKTSLSILIPVLVVLFIAIIVLVSSCKGFGKKGNGRITTSEREISPFTKISIEGIFPVELSQDGGKEFVKIETDENLQDLIVAKTENGKLTIYMKEKSSIRHYNKMKVYINIKDLHELKSSSVGNVTTVGTLKLDSLVLNSLSVGKLELNIDANYLHADLQSVGSTILKGTTHEARINNKSVGALSAFDHKAGTLMIHNQAVGSTEIYADSAFYIRSSAIGVLYYKGPGEVKELTSEGIGKVQKKE